MLDNTLTYELYPISQLSDWMLHNLNNGISERMITRVKAIALINNPDARLDDIALSVVKDGDTVVGYTAVFAEQLIKPFPQETFYWGSTQWLEPDYRGKGISAKMMLQLKEAINHRYLGLDSSIASCKLDQKQGYTISQYPRYFFQWKTAGKSRLIARIKEQHIKCGNHKAIKTLSRYTYTNRYLPLIDDMAYAFIEKHSHGDLFLRSQAMLNWILRYPFLHAINGDHSVEKELCDFGSYVDSFDMGSIAVYVHDIMCGIYIYSIVDGIFKVLYLYYDEQYKERVFSSLITKAVQSNAKQFRTFNKDLYDFMQQQGIRSMNSKFTMEQIALTLPPNIHVDPSLAIQGGDGDMFC